MHEHHYQSGHKRFMRNQFEIGLLVFIFVLFFFFFFFLLFHFVTTKKKKPNKTVEIRRSKYQSDVSAGIFRVRYRQIENAE